MNLIHTTVLLHESIDGLNLEDADIYLDGTLGSAGHMFYALTKAQELGHKLIAIGLDRDTDALQRSEKRLEPFKNPSFKIILKEGSYADISKILDELAIPKVNKIMLDLGLSSDQFETSSRGFSFKRDEPLLMTFKKDINEGDITAKLIVNTWEENTLADIIYGYGEEKYARRIARALVGYRSKKSIDTTSELVEIISQAVPSFYRHGRIHPATRTFQALRIAANDELNVLKKGLENGFERLEKKGRMAVISFHSLEDRIVKNFNKEKVDKGEALLVHKKPITPTDEEIEKNPRSRSSKLRILEKI